MIHIWINGFLRFWPDRIILIYFSSSENDAESVFGRQRDAIAARWDEVCAEAQLSEVDKSFFWRRQFLNPFVFEETEDR